MPTHGFDRPLRRASGRRSAAAAAPLPIPAVWLGVVTLSAAFWICLVAAIL